jgi:hypothetical protein
MRKIIKDLRRMKYFKNYSATSGAVHNIAKHEHAVEDVLRGHGLKRIARKVKIAARDEMLMTGAAPDLPDNTFIPQPCGTHASPDFIVKRDGKLYFIECKSAKGGTPMYNSGVPKAQYIYVFCSKKHNQTTVYWGADVLPAEQERLIQEYIAEARTRDQEFNKGLRENGYGIEYYTRPMIQHRGSKEIKDYFLNSNRQKFEQRVLDGV